MPAGRVDDVDECQRSDPRVLRKRFRGDQVAGNAGAQEGVDDDRVGARVGMRRDRGTPIADAHLQTRLAAQSEVRARNLKDSWVELHDLMARLGVLRQQRPRQRAGAAADMQHPARAGSAQHQARPTQVVKFKVARVSEVDVRRVHLILAKQPPAGPFRISLDAEITVDGDDEASGSRHPPSIAPLCSERPMPSPRKRHAVQLFSGLPGHYDRVGSIMSFGQDPRWRKALGDFIAPVPGMRILDVATGTGMVAFAHAASGAEVVGLDQSEAMLGGARARLQRTPELAGRLSFVLGEAESLPFADAEFDALSFTYLLRYVDDRAATMRELVRVVKPGGRIAMVEFGVPSDRTLRVLWQLHTRVGLPLLGRAVSRDWYDVGRFLGPNIEQFHAAEPDLPALWAAAGISAARQQNMSFGAGIVVTGVRDGAATE